MAFNQNGAIVRIRLVNLMTYSDVSLSPGQNLNMIIGPNGSGKSAIVSAIIVGLAGDVSVTGRAANIGSLVRKGCDWASTEIELFNRNGRNHVIQRKMTITSRAEGKLENKTEWKLNGNTVPKRTIQELISELNIKVDNLCQFLPQDSVANFVKMNPRELLIDTLKAAGDTQLVEDLAKLIELTEEISAKSIQLEELKKASAENEVNARRLETEVQELQMREQLVRKRALCSLKLHYVRFVEAAEKYDKAKDELQNKKEELRQQESYGDPFRRKIQFYKVQEEKYRELVRNNVIESKRFIEKIKEHTENLENHKMKCQEEYARFKAIKNQEDSREQQIRLKQQELDSHKCRLDEIKDLDYTNDINNLKTQVTEVQSLMKNKNEEKYSVEVELRKLIGQIEEKNRKKSDLTGTKERRLGFVLNRRRDYQRVCDWLAMNKDSFQKEILLPMYCDLNINDMGFADVVEYVISEQDLYAFVCQTDEDLKKFTQHAHDILKARVNVILQPDKSVEDFEREVSHRGSNPYRGMDFAGFLKDMVEAPEPIMRYLYGQYNFHKIPIFNNLREPELKRMMETCPKFFLKKTFYNIQASRYDNSKTIFNEKIRGAHLLNQNTSNKRQLDELNKVIDELSQRQKDLNSKLDSIKRESHEIQQRFTELKRQISELTNKQNERARIERLIGQFTKALEDLKNDKVDVEVMRIKLQDSIRDIDQKRVDELAELETVFESFAIVRKNHLLNMMTATLAKKNSRLIEFNLEAAMEKTKELEREIKEESAKINPLRDKVLKYTEAAKENIPNFKNGKIDKATQQKFATIEHDTLESLERYEEELKARIQGMHNVVGNQLLSEFHRQTQELRDRKKQISELEASISEMISQQTAIKENFVGRLDEVIIVIDQHYRDFMRKLNYDGKVELAHDQSNSDDFSKYGINIMVKYRDDEQLIPLSSTRQSGGERSVATMIYMLALQTKTSVPFRVVDEINQGMDKDNERKVFELLVRTADESSSQYFLVSPKLLNGLEYGDKMQIHIVFNGPHLNFSFENLMPTDGDEAYASDSTESDDDEDVVVEPSRRSRR